MCECVWCVHVCVCVCVYVSVCRVNFLVCLIVFFPSGDRTWDRPYLVVSDVNNSGTCWCECVLHCMRILISDMWYSKAARSWLMLISLERSGCCHDSICLGSRVPLPLLISQWTGRPNNGSVAATCGPLVTSFTIRSDVTNMGPLYCCMCLW